MQINKIQLAIFKKLCKDNSLTLEEYLTAHSERYLGREITDLEQLSEHDADEWIHRAYLESM